MEQTPATCIETDERFVQDWIDYGIGELEALLSSYARFDAFCAVRDAGFRRLDAAVRSIATA